MEYQLDTTRLSSIHLPEDELLVFKQPFGEGDKIKIKSHFDTLTESGEPEVIISFTSIYDGFGFTNIVTVSVEELKSMLIDCVESPEPMNLHNHPQFKGTRSSIIEEVKAKMSEEFPDALLLDKDAVTSFTDGLGIIYENDKMIGVFESFNIDTNTNDCTIGLEGILFSGTNQSLNNNMKYEYYDLKKDKKLTFKSVISNNLYVEGYEAIDTSSPIIELIKEAVKVPYHEEVGADFINDQEYTEYRNSRLSVISEVREKERKKAIASKFSNIDLF